MTRPPLGPGLARTRRIATRIRESAYDELIATCARMRITTSDAQRAALADWMKKHKEKS